ncbi:translation initiation factor IF-2 [Candidatus Saccharibacteria bacterium]|nr:translation initiation factor IF-2 [Candidatus Saccharibacteria bacterium]
MTDSQNETISTIQIDETMTVGTLAEKLMIPVTKLIAELMKNGVMATVNERIDFDTAQIIVDELGLGVKLEHASEDDTSLAKHRTSRKQAGKNGQVRPPVVAVMGHVDHGKTSLLDAIRESDTAKGEAGGITQHISAYQVTHGDRQITFLDTPGHEAFAALREHGAQLTDLVIIVVAADDGIKPQTLEAIRFAKKADVKIIVAINKIDKEGADQNRVKQQLSENDLMPEEWGGDTIIVPVSAKTKEGMPALLDMVLLVADVEELKADIDVPAAGLVIEAHMEKGRGPIVTALVEAGVLRQGQYVVAGTTYGKVRTLESTNSKALQEAGPSTPVVISGFRELPEFGDEFRVVATEKLARTTVADRARGQSRTTASGISTSGQLMQVINRNIKLQELPVIIKADVKGSVTSVIDSLKTLENEEVSIRVIGSGVGNINETDLHLAHSGNAVIYGFNVQMPPTIKRQAGRDKVRVRLFSIIYELIEDAKGELSNLLAPEIVETELGRLVVKGVFKTTKTEVICGGEVSKGKLTAPALARIRRGKETIGEAEVMTVQKGPQEVKEAVEGDMCGLQLKTESKIELEEGDHIELFTRETVARKL